MVLLIKNIEIMSFTVTSLPAAYGDSLWIEYGDGDKKNRILIDGGLKATKQKILELIDGLPEKERDIELLVISHIDQDHIEGILELFEMEEVPVKVKSVWFNGYHHLDGDEDFGAVQGERLTAAILKKELSWNTEFNGQAVVVTENGIPPVIELEGGMKLTLLSPTIEKLHLLKPVWENEVRKAGLLPGFGYEEPEVIDDDNESFGTGTINVEELAAAAFEEDKREGNGSSIAFIAEYKDKSVLFCADAHPNVLLESLEKTGRTNNNFNAIKISHHGSHKNTGPKFLNAVKSNVFIISTSGAKYKHPSLEAIAQIIKLQSGSKKLYFNYKTEFNEMWDDLLLKEQYDYQTFYGDNKGVTVTV